MSGSLIGGVIGAAIGFVVGGPTGAYYGWMIGGIAGGILMPPDGPSLGDLKPQSSEYGRPIPICRGTIAIGGNVIWASEFTIVEGGKGGEPEADAAYGNMAVAVCEGVRRLGRIWAGPDKRLIWDGAILEGAEAGAVLRWYSGTEDQLPDALIESYEGVGVVPGYRGTAYLVLENFPLLKDGNRLPFLTIETGAESEAILAPEDLGVVSIQQVVVTAANYIVVYQGSYYGFIIRDLATNTLVAHYVYPVGQWDTTGREMVYDADRDVMVQHSGDLDYVVWDMGTGARTEHTITAAPGADANLGTAVKGCVYHNGNYIFAAAGSAGVPERVTLYLIDPDTFDPVATYAGDTAAGAFVGPLRAPINSDAYVYGYSNPTRLTRFALASGAAAVDLGTPASSTINAMQVDPNTGLIWTMHKTSGSNLEIHVNDPATQTLVYSENVAFPAALADWPSITFVAGSPNKAIVTGEQWLAIDAFAVFNADAPALISVDVGGYHGAAPIDVMAYNPVTNNLMAFHDGGWVSFGLASDPTTVNYLQAGTFTPETDNKYLGDDDATGIVAPQGELLSVIVADLSERAGLPSAQYDVTQLANDTVDGYAIERSTTVRDAITALMPAYFFDAVESGGVAKFVKRGGAIAATIDDDELGAYESGTEPVDPLESTRQMENELPQTLNVRYLSEATKYSPASRYARRLIGASGDEQTLDLPLVLSDTKAQEISEVDLHAAWVGRITYRFSLPRKYAYLEPTDVIVVLDHTMRLEKMTYKSGRFQCEARHEDASVYTPNVVVTEPTPDNATVSRNTEIVLELM